MSFEAYVFVTTTNPGPRAAAKRLRQLEGVIRADALFGGPAVVAIVKGQDLQSLEAVVDAIVELPMVRDTHTHIVRPIDCTTRMISAPGRGHRSQATPDQPALASGTR